MTDLSRRSLFAGLGALIAAPAIVRAASLMPVRAIVPVWRNTYLTLNDIWVEVTLNDIWVEESGQISKHSWDAVIPTLNKITREAVRQFRNSNANIDQQWTERFSAQPEWVETVYPIVHAA